MERPGDDFKETHNVTVAPRDTLFGGQVSRLQVAEVVGAAISRTQLAENKVRQIKAAFFVLGEGFERLGVGLAPTGAEKGEIRLIEDSARQSLVRGR